MTCEVAVMNKYAVVIAADSAVTTSSGNGAERYSKGGNKIFQLSRVEPVGVMIFGSAMLDGVPWEIIIKDFRERLGNSTYSTVQAYASAFFESIRNSDHFFPPDDRDSKLFVRVVRVAIDLISEARDNISTINDLSLTILERTSAWNDFLNIKNAELSSVEMHDGISENSLELAVTDVIRKINDYEAFTDYLVDQNLNEVINLAELVKTACSYFFKNFSSVLGRTGIVFSGFGSDQYFPSVIQYDVFGFVKDDFLYSDDKNNSCDIGHEIPSGIFQFAMTSSIDTFTTGVGLDTYREVGKAYLASASSLVDAALHKCNILERPDDFDSMLSASSDAFSKEWLDKMLAVHWHPMKQVIASLPIQEMVHLAETLIVLQSLKERITTHSESVGGPVDVAVITKAEGLVWIKRKHYFDADRNLPYVLRQRARYGDSL